jgi:hypothetical protein
MIDPYVLMAPVFLLGVLALIHFVGCLSKPSPPSALAVTSIDKGSGPAEGGTNFTLMGDGFFDPLTILFDTADATNVTATSRTTAVGTTSPHPAGTVAINVSEGSQFATLPAAFTYIAVTHAETVTTHGGSGSTSLTATLNTTGQNRTVVATILWRASTATDKAQAQDPRFLQIAAAQLNPHNVTHFHAQALGLVSCEQWTV